MKRIQKLIGLLLVFCMLFSMLPVSVQATEGGSCGDNLIWKFLDGVLSISGTGPMDDYAWSTPPWDGYDIIYLSIEPGVTHVGAYAFSGCMDLESVILSNSVETIGKCAFSSCSNLKKITFSNSLKEIGENAFSGCESLTHATLPNTLTTIKEGAFRACFDLDLVIPDSVTTIDPYAFENCGLVYLDLPKNLTEITLGSFLGCSCLRSIVIPEGVQSIGPDSFWSCVRLTSVTIPESVTQIYGNAFAACDNLKDIYFTGSEDKWNRISVREGALPENVTIHFNMADPTVRPDHNCPSLKYFIDAPSPDNQAHVGIDYCVENGLMNGTDILFFNPGGLVSRAQLVTILYRAAGWPWAESQGTFSDVPEDTWYSEAVEWAAAEDIVKGIGGGKFGPDQNITREQIATILYRFDGEPKVEGSLDAFPDKENVSDFAYDAMIWATSTGLINGVNANDVTTLAPKDNATREQIAAIIMRYLEET